MKRGSDINRWYLPRQTSTSENGFGEVDVPGIFPTNYNTEGILRWADNSYTVADNLTMQRGKHTFKTGFEFRYVVSGRIQKQNPVYTYNSVAVFLANTPASIKIQWGTPGADMRQGETGIYFQDDYKVTSNLILNLGLRWEYYSPWQGSGVAHNIQSGLFGPIAPRGAEIYKT